MTSYPIKTKENASGLLIKIGLVKDKINSEYLTSSLLPQNWTTLKKLVAQ